MHKQDTNRREFLKTTSIIGIALGAFSFGGGFVPLLAREPISSLPKRTLGKGSYALEVSALAFGCMGLNYHRSQNLSKNEARKILEAAINAGITLFDTAQVYGPDTNEILVGELLKPYNKRIFIATKFGFGKEGDKAGDWVLDSSPKRIREVVENSLKRLHLEQIPLLYQHRADPKTPIEEIASTVKELIKEGKVARFGVCELSATTIQKAHRICPITAVQSEYHLMWRNVESELFPTLEKLGIGFVAYSPLNRGYLSGKLNKNSTFDPTNDNRQTLPRFEPNAMEANYQIIEILKAFGRGKNPHSKDKNASPAQVAIAYLLAKKPYIVPLFGTTKREHLSENMNSLSLKLTQADLKELDTALDKVQIVGDRYPIEQANRVGK
ncbi:aldo/keto reductase [Helicobacter sp. MIT 14-3879]|uniref:aldo/keto reductase n=1 Tax=Helicobacter sp. MIT 14-3879 TaxID=2040649 RepID=UPI000E1E6AAF|nr:aldo/keto reductase [Helicobacter sp. MIT 14-3879]RDU60885.1 aldo/keto reductase [Helicobacter sp. MIT 14-3879]